VRLRYALGFIALAVLIFPVRASAQFTVCNRTSQDKVNVALVGTWFNVVNGQRVLNQTSAGWYGIAKGSCRVLVTSDISSYDIYIYAYSASNPSIKWSDKYNYCMDPKNNFTYLGPQVTAPCKAGSPMPTMYIETSGTAGVVDPNGAVRPLALPMFTYNLVDKK
jgi:uncharacterized membrane protein